MVKRIEEGGGIVERVGIAAPFCHLREKNEAYTSFLSVSLFL